MKKFLSLATMMLLGISSVNAQTTQDISVWKQGNTINAATAETEEPTGNYEAYIEYDKSRLTGWDFPPNIKLGESIKIPYSVYSYADDLKDVVITLMVNGEAVDKTEVATIVVDEDFGEGTYTGLFNYEPTNTGTVEFQLTLDFYGAALDESGEHETEPVSIEVLDPSVDNTPVLEDLAALKAFEATSLGNIKVELQDVKVTYTSGTYVVLEDASAGYALQSSGLDAYVKAGQTLNGELILKTEQSGMFGTIIYTATEESMANVEVTDGEPHPIEVTTDNVADYLSNFDWRLAKFSDAEISIEAGNYGDVIYASIPVFDGKTEINDSFQAITDWPTNGDKVNIIGYLVNMYGFMQYIQPIAIEAVTTDGVKTVKLLNQTPTAVYSLNGARVTTPQKGIYIQNGKKTMVK